MQDERFDVSHLTNVKKITLFGRTKTITYHKGFPLKEKARCECAMFKRFTQTKLRAMQVLTLEFLKSGHCVWFEVAHIFLTANGKESCQYDQTQVEGIAIYFLFSSSKLTSYH